MSPDELKEILGAVERMRKSTKEDIDAIGATLVRYMEKLDKHTEWAQKTVAELKASGERQERMLEKHDQMLEDHERWLRDHHVRLDRLETRSGA